MKAKYIIILLVLISVFSCKNEGAETVIQLEGLTLNNNEKWVANEETHIGMKHMDSILKKYPDLDGEVLVDALSKETGYIIKNCDMKGEEHDQLHVVLLPILESISNLKDLANASDVEKEVTKLKQLTTTYFQYFKN